MSLLRKTITYFNLNYFITGGSKCFTLGLSNEKNENFLLRHIHIRPIELDITSKKPENEYPEIISAKPAKMQWVNI